MSTGERRQYPAEFTAELKAHYRKMLSRAAERGIESAITPEEFISLWRKSRGRCNLTGIHFTTERIVGGWRNPFGPSVDRIDSSAGYTRDNVRFVCVAVNYALNEWGEDVLRLIAQALCNQQRDAGTILRSGKKKARNGHPTDTARIKGRNGNYYIARVRIEGKQYTLGRYKNASDAARRSRQVRLALQSGMAISDFATRRSKKLHNTRQPSGTRERPDVNDNNSHIVDKLLI